MLQPLAIVLDSVSRCITSLLPLCCSTGDHFSGTHAVAITFNGVSVDAVSTDIPSNDAVSMGMNISVICHWTTGRKRTKDYHCRLEESKLLS
jgi:hypothetical protein